MPGLFDNPMALMQLGGSLMAAGQEQPYGVSRGQVLAQGLQGVGKSMAAQQQMDMQRQAFELKKKEFEAKQAAAQRQAAHQQAAMNPQGLFGGPSATPASVQKAGLELQPKAGLTLEQKRQLALKAAAQAEAGGMPGLAGFYRDLAKPQEGYTLAPGATRFDANNEPVASVPSKPEAGSGLSKLIAERNALPPGHPMLPIYNAAVAKAALPSRMTASIPTDNGVIEISSGPDKDQMGALTNSTRSKIESKVVSLEDSMQSVMDMEARFKPEFQEIGTRWENMMTAAKDKLGFRPADADRKSLSEYTQFRQSVGRNFSTTLKELSGAAVAEHEMKRAEGFVPNAGTGLWDGDSPTQLQAKISGMKQFTLKALARQKYYLKQGVTNVNAMAKAMPIDSVRVKVNPETGQKIILVNGKWEAI